MKQLQCNFTTIEQSKRLLELGVPAWTADCYFDSWEQIRWRILGDLDEDFFEKYPQYIPSWSVGRLIAIYELCTGVKFERWSHKGVYNNNLIDDCIEHIKFAVNPDTTINFDFKKL